MVGITFAIFLCIAGVYLLKEKKTFIEREVIYEDSSNYASTNNHYVKPKEQEIEASVFNAYSQVGGTSLPNDFLLYHMKKAEDEKNQNKKSEFIKV